MAAVAASRTQPGDLLILKKNGVWHPAIRSNSDGNAFVVDPATGHPRFESIREYDEIREARMIDADRSDSE